MQTTSLTILAVLLMTLAACTGEAQPHAQTPISEDVVDGLEVIQFHSTHRCMTCLKIEELTRAALPEDGRIPFSLVDVDDPANADMAESFEATGTALFLVHRASGRRQNLTDFAFLNAHDEEGFTNGLVQHIRSFPNQDDGLDH